MIPIRIKRGWGELCPPILARKGGRADQHVEIFQKGFVLIENCNALSKCSWATKYFKPIQERDCAEQILQPLPEAPYTNCTIQTFCRGRVLGLRHCSFFGEACRQCKRLKAHLEGVCADWNPWAPFDFLKCGTIRSTPRAAAGKQTGMTFRVCHLHVGRRLVVEL